jgi:hypothetical protein
VRALTDDDGGGKSATDPTTAEDDGPSPSDSGTDGGTDGGTDDPSSTISPTGIQCTGGNPTPTDVPEPKPAELSGGGLTIPRVEPYVVDPQWSDPFNFANDVLVAFTTVTEKWASEYIVGGLPRQNGFEDPAQSAELVMQCLTMNDRVYLGFESRDDLKNEEITVDGKPGHLITSEIRVSDPSVGVEGDVTSVVVVDTGDPDHFGVYIGVVPIGDADLIAEQESVIERISVN